MVACTIQGVSTYDSSLTQMFPLLRVNLFLTCGTPGSIPSPRSYLNSDESYNLKFYMVGSPQHLALSVIFSGRGILRINWYLHPFFSKVIMDRISLTHVSPLQIQPWDFISPIAQVMTICQIYVSFIMFLIFCLLFTIAKFALTIMWFGSCDLHWWICPWPLISASSLTIKPTRVFICLFIVWGHLNARPKYISVQYLSWTSVLHYTTDNHASSCIVVFRNVSKTNFLYHSRNHRGVYYHTFFPSEWLWNYVCYIWLCPSFSIILRVNIESINV